ncbi:MAG: tRNA 2-thiouridine(34) synthase MnmA [Epsilonproteobacteria bacterium]|nr:tRNA 2-thiouridine(34) synthase MnmA [Campylobacterota bacterium]
MKKRVLVGISGGVDSAVSVYLLQQQGYEVVGLYLKMHSDVNHQQNIAKIETLSRILNIEYHVEDVTDVFREEVYNYFVTSYKDGSTPNPCAMCNIKIKFGEFQKYLPKYKCDYLATGHYVRSDGQFLYKAKDTKKDQSYFMFGISKQILPKCIFPLGEYTKAEIKQIAAQIGLHDIAYDKESQDICFIPTNYIDILTQHFNTNLKGKVINTKKQVIGTHKGYMHYTIGQRKGFNLFRSHVPHYVIGIDSKTNKIIVGHKDQLAKKVIFLKQCNLFTDQKSFECEVKVRYKSDPIKALVKIDKTKACVFLSQPAYSIAKGQACVFYDNDKVLGGGWIRGAKK